MGVIQSLKCLRCGAEWLPRQVGLPKNCPRCGSPNWNKNRPIPKYMLKRQGGI